MRIIVNGEACEVIATSLNQILIDLAYAEPMIATAVNSEFVHKDKRGQIQLSEGDRLEVLSPISGG